MGFPKGQGKTTIVAGALTERGRIAPFVLPRPPLPRRRVRHPASGGVLREGYGMSID